MDRSIRHDTTRDRVPASERGKGTGNDLTLSRPSRYCASNSALVGSEVAWYELVSSTSHEPDSTRPQASCSLLPITRAPPTHLFLKK